MMTENEKQILRLIASQPSAYPDLQEIANLLAGGYIRFLESKYFVTSGNREL